MQMPERLPYTAFDFPVIGAPWSVCVGGDRANGPSSSGSVLDVVGAPGPWAPPNLTLGDRISVTFNICSVYNAFP